MYLLSNVQVHFFCQLQGKQLPLEEVRIVLDPLLSNPKIDKVAHNAKFDLLVLRQAGFSLEPITFDTMIAEWLINPTSRNLGLKSQAWIRLGVEMTHIEALIGTGRNQISMAQVPIAQAAPYAAADAAMFATDAGARGTPRSADDRDPGGCAAVGSATAAVEAPSAAGC